jgi:hypothetical protein
MEEQMEIVFSSIVRNSKGMIAMPLHQIYLSEEDFEGNMDFRCVQIELFMRLWRME